MPFCSKCGNQVRPDDRFCKACGTPQPVDPNAPKSASDPFANVDSHVVQSLCYIPFVGWIVSIYAMSVERFRPDRLTRFHAFQGLYTFVAWLIYDWVLESVLYGFIPRAWILNRLIKLAFVCGWIYMVYQTSQKVLVRIPFLADLADKSVDEQK
jgi:uncharacterized membrane protein